MRILAINPWANTAPGAAWVAPTFNTGPWGFNYSNNNRTVGHSGQNACTAGAAKTTGKWYCEFFTENGLVGNEMIGVATTGSTTYMGNYASSFGRDYGSQYASGMGTVTNNYGIGFGPSNGDRYGIAVDMDAREFWVHVSGVYLLGDPVAGTMPQAQWTATGLALKPGVRVYIASSTVTIPETFNYIPSGFQPWTD